MNHADNYHTIIVNVPVRFTVFKGSERQAVLALKHRAQDRLAKTGQTIMEPWWEEVSEHP